MEKQQQHSSSSYGVRDVRVDARTIHPPAVQPLHQMNPVPGSMDANALYVRTACQWLESQGIPVNLSVMAAIRSLWGCSEIVNQGSFQMTAAIREDFRKRIKSEQQAMRSWYVSNFPNQPQSIAFTPPVEMDMDEELEQATTTASLALPPTPPSVIPSGSGGQLVTESPNSRTLLSTGSQYFPSPSSPVSSTTSSLQQARSTAQPKPIMKHAKEASKKPK